MGNICALMGGDDLFDIDEEPVDVEPGQTGGGAGGVGPGPSGNYGVDPNAAIEAHNRKRDLHGAPPLTWSDTCAQHALAAAKVCADQNCLQHQNASEYNEGQNLYMAWSSGGGAAYGAKDAVKSWYDEVADYDFGNPGFDGSTGHFTQLVWKGTTQVGMAKAVASDGSVYIAANYSPAGNMMGDFENNVSPA
mmetsp:Transcript_3592/g.7886  ORF Transcript_3592/g.7886 Transcript_3592/m.7886 type:complete len:192 (-) Transcript_3592:272-847(-)|eukprot:CAMPEP_0178408124 /NCGR_PEP_ID=MMETSP0689_2-20121128/19778_1 /TAXON_ID=160604 /ORGANISM="Amphidinium massartii, Strain CS-259" /LENGTH=191 /DNA_ID=CAMNT_0020029211 /DNA_START=81 /DNA_END=656 /DNA_ORIENTATION=-